MRLICPPLTQLDVALLWHLVALSVQSAALCLHWVSFVGQLPCREPTFVQCLIGLSALSRSLLCFAYRAQPFPPISPSQERRQDDDDDILS